MQEDGKRGLQLQLVNGDSFRLIAREAEAAASLAELRRMISGSKAVSRSRISSPCLIEVVRGNLWDRPLRTSHTLPGEARAVIRVSLGSLADHPAWMRLSWISSPIPSSCELKGGLLLHAGLIEREGVGLAIIGTGDALEAAQFKQLPAPWRTLSEQAVLVVPVEGDGYWAHPWPAWNAAINGEHPPLELNAAVPLRRMIFLEQGAREKIQRLGEGYAATMLAASADQLAGLVNHYTPRGQVMVARERRLVNASALAEKLPAYLLKLSADGTFWKQLDFFFRSDASTILPNANAGHLKRFLGGS